MAGCPTVSRGLGRLVPQLLLLLLTLATPLLGLQLALLDHAAMDLDVQAVTAYLEGPTAAQIGAAIQVSTLAATDAPAAVTEADYDLLLVDPFTYSCLSKVSNVVLLATLQTNYTGTPNPYLGGVISTHANRTHLHNLDQLPGRRVAITSTDAIAASRLVQAELNRQGLNALNDPLQYILATDDEDLMALLEANETDYIFLPMGFIETHPEHAPALHPLNRQNATHSSDTLIRSTEIVPQWSLIRSESGAVDAQAASAMISALLADISSSTFSWISGLGFTRAFEIWEETVPAYSRQSCQLIHSDIAQSLTCPAGSVAQTNLGLQYSCLDLGLTCPPREDCFCQPCYVGSPVEVRYIPASNNDSAVLCPQLATCATTQQLQAVQLRIVNNVFTWDQPTIVSVFVHVGGAIATYNITLLNGIDKSLNLTFSQMGVHLVEVEADRQVAADAFFIDVQARDCGDSLRQPNARGECECKASYYDLGGYCQPLSGLLVMAVFIGVLLIAIILFLKKARQLRILDHSWRIQKEELDFPREPVVLGKGSFGNVILAEFRGFRVAVKVVSRTKPKEALTDDNMERAVGFGMYSSNDLLRVKAEDRVRREMRVIAKINHPCILTAMAAVIEGRELMTVYEYMEHGSLANLLKSDKLQIDNEILMPIVQDIVLGMQYLHNNRPVIVHCDLKADNILIDSNFRAKIGDFSLSAFGLGKPMSGSPAWMAPEVINGELPSPASDVYSFGILLWEVMHRRLPYEGERLEEVLEAVGNLSLTPIKRPEIATSCPLPIARLINLSWAALPNARVNFDYLAHELKEMHIKNVGLSMLLGRKNQKEQARVLHDVFPPHIAEKLRKGIKVEPEHHEDVTLFFSDIKGFTNISSALSPVEVSDMLDRLYTKFDAIADELNIFKVETIGDAFMAVTNLAEQQSDHTARMVKFAMRAVEAAGTTLILPDEPTMGSVVIRVGIHSGPVVANVVGTKNARYCLFGDTVNTASRMESNSEAGRIHLSLDAAERLQAQDKNIPLEARPPMMIKGKGMMQTFFIAQALNRNLALLRQESTL